MAKLNDIAVVLVSGGLDSATTLAICQDQGYRVHALTFNYGQRHVYELEAAKRVASAAGVVRHLVADLDPRLFAGSALTTDTAIPKDREYDAIMERNVPVTYVPSRNTVFLSCALAWSESLGAGDLFIGVNAQDYSGYPDCRPEYIDAYQRMADLGTKTGVQGRGGIRIHTPIIELTKGQIIQQGLDLGVDYSLTSTCYDPAAGGAACGRCDACVLRLKGFAECGSADPVRYHAADQRK